MGHYASEMMGPGDQEVDKTYMKKLINQEVSGIVWRWEELYPQKEKSGTYIPSNEEITCPKCFSQVKAILRVNHEKWHQGEFSKHMFGSPGLLG